jgi:hypothetical protein
LESWLCCGVRNDEKKEGIGNGWGPFYRGWRCLGSTKNGSPSFLWSILSTQRRLRARGMCKWK